ncbi:MAG: glycosyltransferase family 9 protein, partial [Candidatus Brocadiia bacterium]
MQPAEQKPDICLFRSGALGDSILMLPTVHHLALAMPDASLLWIGGRHLPPICAMDGVSWQPADYDSGDFTPLFSRSPSGPPPVLGQTQLAVVYTSEPDGRLVHNLRSGIKGKVITHPVSPPAGCHAARHYMRAVTDRRQIASAAPTLNPPEGTIRDTRSWLTHSTDSASPVAIIHPGSGSMRKCWPAEKFHALTANLLDRGISPILLEGPADSAQCRDIGSEFHDVPVFRSHDIQRTTALLHLADICICNDSGIGHLSGASRCDTLSIFGPTDPHVWRPVGPTVRVITGSGSNTWPSAPEVTSRVLQMLGRGN